ncbi:cytochrome P450 [Hymenopellis radicata]|nr:cytochrome P450 [Hymenopellis radicata]
MSPGMSFPLIITLVVIVVCSLVKKRISRKPLPPGPSGLPLLGSALDMAKPYPWLKFTEWSRQYGDVVHVNAAGQSVIILSSRKAISDLFDQRGAMYSNRPRMVMGGEVVGWGEGVPLSSYGNRLREFRKLLSEALTARKVQDYHPLEEEKTRDFLVDLLRNPEDFLYHIRRVAAAIVFKITHGYDLVDGEDPLLASAERSMLEFSEISVPGAYMVDNFPFLKYLPRWLGLNWMKKGELYRKHMEIFVNEPYDAVKRQVAEGTAQPSFVASLVERNRNPTAEQEDIYKWVTAGFYGGGADTTVSALASFFLAMSLYPDVQRKAQAEIKQVVGSTRLPSLSDRGKLPYTEALLYEVYRWNPVAPTAIPHAAAKDDAYAGYFIPAGSIMIPNSWGVLHDPQLYPDPFEFKPERYTDDTEDELNPDPRKFVFGYGRRICPGQYLADDSVFIAIAMVLAVYDILPPKENVPKRDFSLCEGYTSGIISHPEPFECRIIPRSSEAEALIKANDPKERP